MKKILLFFKGKKSYICFGLLFIVGGLHSIGVLNDSSFQSMAALLGSLGGIALRAALNQAE